MTMMRPPGGKNSLGFGAPAGVAFDAGGAVYINDGDNHVIRKVDSHGVITTYAGNHKAGYSGDGAPAIWLTVAGYFNTCIVVADTSFRQVPSRRR